MVWIKRTGEFTPKKREAVLTVIGEKGILTAENPVAPHDGHELLVETTDGRRVETVAGKTTYFHQLQHAVAVIAGDARPITGGSDAVRILLCCRPFAGNVESEQS